MGSKYAKLFCFIVAIVLVSILQFRDFTRYFAKSLPYVEVGEYKELHTTKQREESVVVKEAETVATISGINKLNAVGAVLLDGNTGRILYGKNENEELAMASTTKIMTCIVALEQGNLDDVVTVSSYAARMPDVQLNINTGEQYYLKDLLYSLMLESHNDSAVAIAEHIGGSVEGFAKLMNEKAKELGCEHTQFVTPNGLDAPEHYTTATELGRIACYAIHNPTFIEITNAPTHEFIELTNEKKLIVTNKNRFLYMMEGAIGVKTGFTNNAGYCFVGALKRDNTTYVSVVLGSGWPPNKTYKWNDTTRLMNYGLDNYKYQPIMNKRVELNPLYVEGGKISKAKIYTEGNLALLLRKDEEVVAKYLLPNTIKAPVTEGMEVGQLGFYINGELFTSVPIYSEETVGKTNIMYYMKKFWNAFLGQIIEAR